MEAGTAIRPASIAVLAAGGHGSVRVHRRVRVAVLGTGDELVPPGQLPGPAQITDSNSYALAAQALAAGAEVIRLGIASDTREAVLERLRVGLERADVIVVSGGVSVGAHDEVKAAFEDDRAAGPVAGRRAARQAARVRPRAASGRRRETCSCSGCRATR